MKLELHWPDGIIETAEYNDGVSAEEILRDQKHACEHAILGCRKDRVPVRLNEPLHEDGMLELLDIRDAYANMSYQTTLIFLYIHAVHAACGRDVQIKVENSLSKGLFTTIHGARPDRTNARRIQKYMQEQVQAKTEIHETWYQREDVISEIRRHGGLSRIPVYETAPEVKGSYQCEINGESDFFFIHTLPHCGYLHSFEVRPYRTGLLLRFPHFKYPDNVPPFAEQPVLYGAFSEENHWQKLMHVHYAYDLNRMVESGQAEELVMLSEALHEKKIANIAELIRRKKKRIILIAGPSSSGKTSFARRLCIQLRVSGLNPLYLGTDDYFVDRKDMVPDENGELDFEALDAVDITLFGTQMNGLLKGDTVDIPEFDFIDGKKIFGKRIVSIEPDQPIVIEGIHALNPKLTEGIAEDEKYRIYISPLTQLNIDRHHRVPTTDARMLRRMVRDHRTRGREAAQTIREWASVRRGEETWIFPYNGEADTFFNSHCLYELSVLKKYARPLLEGITPDQPEYPEAQRMLDFLAFFTELEDDSVILNNSILREFIGGSILVK